MRIERGYQSPGFHPNANRVGYSSLVADAFSEDSRSKNPDAKSAQSLPGPGVRPAPLRARALSRRVLRRGRGHVGAEDEGGGDELGGERFSGGEKGKPGARPSGKDAEQEGDRGFWEPAGELHFLSLFSDHDEKNEGEHDAGDDEHLPVRKPAVQDEGNDSNEGSEYRSCESSEKDGQAAEAETVALQKQDHLKALAVKTSEAEKSEAPEDAAFASEPAALVEKVLFPAIVERNPAGPVSAVKKPIHHEQKDQDREKAGGRLQSEGGNAGFQVVENADRDSPGDERGDKPECDTQGDRTPKVFLGGAAKAGHDRGEDKNTFEALAEDEDGDIEDGGGLVREGERKKGEDLRRAEGRGEEQRGQKSDTGQKEAPAGGAPEPTDDARRMRGTAERSAAELSVAAH